MTLNGNPNDEFGVEVSPTGPVTIAGLAFKSSSLYNAGTLTLINSTISGNTALLFPALSSNAPSTAFPNGGGIWNGAVNSGSHLVMRNSLVAGNKSPAGPDILGALTSQGYNLIQNTQDTTFAPSQLYGTDLLQVTPTALRMDPLLKDNNGSTQTHALLPGSVTIDRIPPSDCHIKDISTDQRGMRRPQGVACDIGAYELLK